MIHGRRNHPTARTWVDSLTDSERTAWGVFLAGDATPARSPGPAPSIPLPDGAARRHHHEQEGPHHDHH